MDSLKAMVNSSITMVVFSRVSSGMVISTAEATGPFLSQRREKLKVRSSSYLKQRNYHNKLQRSTLAISNMESFAAMVRRHGAQE